MWQKRTIRLDKNFPVKAKPGNNVFVANGGDVLFQYPSSWLVKPSETSICFYDVEPPADQCVLELSFMHLNFAVDWRDCPLDEMLCRAVGGESGSHDLADVHTLQRAGLQIVWLEYEFTDQIGRASCRER